jgi:UDP-N-acetylmuramoylalanine--D-glutamate ligase
LLDQQTHWSSQPKIWRFSSVSTVQQGIFVRDNKIFFNTDNQEEYLMQIEEIGLKGRHNLHNGLATALAARAAEIRIEYIRDSLMKFEGVEHRLEYVRELDGVKYINDSKATNVNAVWYALDSIHVPTILILGGRDKGNDYSELVEQIKQKVHTIIAIGEGQKAIIDQLKEHVPYLLTADSMEQAVKEAKKVAKRGESVLLSPACASFDMFENYEHRGQEFKKYVNNL